ncbi:MAG: TlpA family protein disulfide reductase [Bacteroidia bacterium]|nr:TlpA family protein disulfide reductase [Bacteroidia bacterium]
MKKLKIIAFLLIMPCVLFAGPVTISGSLSNCDIKNISITVEKTFIAEDQVLEELKVKNNAFSHTFDLDRNRIVKLTSEDFTISLYVEPGDDLHINFDPNNENPVKFDGKAAHNNEVYSLFKSNFKDHYDLNIMKDKIMTTSFDPFEIEAYDNRRDQKKFIKEHPAYASTSKQFQSFLDHTLRYQYYNQLLAYPIVRGNSNKDPKVVALPRIIVDEVEGLVASNNDAIISEAYRNFLLYYSTYFTSKNNNYQKYTDYSVSLMHKTEYTNGNLIEEAQFYMIAKFTYDICEKAGSGLVSKNYSQLKKNTKYQHYADAISAKCGDAMKSPTKAEPVKVKTKTKERDGGIDFAFKNLEGNMVNINDYRGKIIYIDFWASWCGPCRVQFPYSHKLQEKFTDKQKKDIVFLYLSIDASEERWKSSVKSFKLTGEQGISPGNWSSEAVKKFGVSSIPRYMIIGKDGKILDPNAPRPGAPGLYEKLVELL